MGVISKEDIVICLSKSGESSEIISLSNYLNKSQIKLIGISCVNGSSLEKISDMFIHTKIEREACHNNLAPTTSSACHLAVGDAIAMAVQKLKGFSPDQFGEYHPSGSLGKKLNLSLDTLIDSKRIPIVNPSSSFVEVIDEISSKMYGATAVTKDNEIVGIITDGDIRRVIEKRKNIEDIIASEFMSSNPKILKSDILANEALKIMRKNNISQVLIADKNNSLIGVVHILDIIKQGINDE
jgi:arabinose-5-phosphate isomerase